MEVNNGTLTEPPDTDPYVRWCGSFHLTLTELQARPKRAKSVDNFYRTASSLLPKNKTVVMWTVIGFGLICASCQEYIETCTENSASYQTEVYHEDDIIDTCPGFGSGRKRLGDACIPVGHERGPGRRSCSRLQTGPAPYPAGAAHSSLSWRLSDSCHAGLWTYDYDSTEDRRPQPHHHPGVKRFHCSEHLEPDHSPLHM